MNGSACRSYTFSFAGSKRRSPVGWDPVTLEAIKFCSQTLRNACESVWIVFRQLQSINDSLHRLSLFLNQTCWRFCDFNLFWCFSQWQNWPQLAFMGFYQTKKSLFIVSCCNWHRSTAANRPFIRRNFSYFWTKVSILERAQFFDLNCQQISMPRHWKSMNELIIVVLSPSQKAIVAYVCLLWCVVYNWF